jgi:hypothetical protein
MADLNSATIAWMADGYTFTPRTMNMSSRRPMQRARQLVRAFDIFDLEDITAAVPHEWHRFASQRRVHRLAHGSRLDSQWLARDRVDQLGPHDPLASPRRCAFCADRGRLRR